MFLSALNYWMNKIGFLPSLNKGDRFSQRGNVTIDHIDDLKFFFMQLMGTGGTAIVYCNYIETLIRQAPDS